MTGSASEFVEAGVSDGVLTLRMNRPAKKNAIDRAMYAALAAALRDADGDAGIGAVLLCGVPGAFSSGNDIRDFMAFASGEGGMDEVEAFLLALAGARKPLVAAVDGLAIGVGTTMLMHCDLVYASPRSVFQTPFLDLGLVPEAASSLLAPRLMGHGQAFALLVLGEAFDADRAEAARLVTRIVAESVEADALAAAKALARKPRQALRIARDLVRGDRQEVVERIRLEAGHFAERLRSDEARQAFAAFMAR